MRIAINVIALALISILGIHTTVADDKVDIPIPPSAESVCETQSYDFLGHWRFVMYYYKDNFMNPRDPQMVLNYHFDIPGKNTVNWNNQRDKVFCERGADQYFSESDCILTQWVTWTNPKNSMNCSSDPDMRVGAESDARADIKDGYFYLHLKLGGDRLVYIWKRMDSKNDARLDKSKGL